MKALIVEDEFMPGEHLRELVHTHCTSIEAVDLTNDPREGVRLLQGNYYDLLLLDVEMPYLNGFELIDVVGIENIPPTVFTTAYSQYAIDAFKVRAMDYLLKPVDPVELSKAVHHVLSITKSQHQKNRGALTPYPGEDYDERIALPEGQEYHLVRVENIVRVEGEGSYSTFYLKDNRRITTSRRLNIYVERLSRPDFFRTHRSHLVNLQYVLKYSKSDGGELYLQGGHRVPVSATVKTELQVLLGVKA